MGEEQQDQGSGTVATDESSRHREVARQGADVGDVHAALAEQVALVKELEKEVMEARHAQLLNRDHVVGIEAEIGRQNDEILRLNAAVRRLQGRETRLTERKKAQAKRIAGLQSRLEAARKRNAALARRVSELESTPGQPTFSRRVVRRLRGRGR